MNYAEEVRTRLAPLQDKVDALTLRERLLVLITALVLIVALWQSLLMQPLAKRATQTRAELTELEERITVANRSLEDQVLQLAGGSGEQRSRVASLRKRIDEINATLGNHASELIDPAEMARVLESVLKEQSRLTLVRIRNSDPELLSASEDASEVTFYRHGLEIEVEGSY
ncbi:MAG: type II secretion system protein M, partial [Gammaproteobacteria bacterium]|nr:type II secretion system protein M [Gammaproteobacteria bacterium]